MLIREIVQLSNSYATLTLPDSLVDIVAGLDEIIYMEKPKRLFFALNAAKRASCITSVQSSVEPAFGGLWDLVPPMQG